MKRKKDDTPDRPDDETRKEAGEIYRLSKGPDLRPPEGEAQDHGALGFVARLLVLATLPHGNPGEAQTFGRTNGRLSLQMRAGHYQDEEGREVCVGLPYGSLPRVLLAWMCTEAVRTRDRVLELGKTLTGFMEQLEILPTGGRWGSIPRLREQMRRLFSAEVSYLYRDYEGSRLESLRVASRARLFWPKDDLVIPKDPNEPPPSLLFYPQPAQTAGRWRSSVTLGERFYQEIISRPVPIDLRALKKLRRSPLALDMFCWLTYRVSYMMAPSTIPWEALSWQFGADYTRLRAFKENFLKRLRDVQEAYPAVQLEVGEKGLTLYPSRLHVLPKDSYEYAREKRKRAARAEKEREEQAKETPTPPAPSSGGEEGNDVPF